MMKAGKWLAIAALATTMTLAPSAVAQGQDGGRQRGGGGNFDPAQMRQRMMERYKEMLEVSNDDEWKAIEPLVTKVMEARMQQVGGMGRGLFGGTRRGGGDQGGGGGGERRGGFMGQQPNPAAETLEKAIEAKAGKAELKAAITKYAEARKAKQAELETAQENLRKVLTTRQEAIATLNGLL
jgi:hypothetical protein